MDVNKESGKGSGQKSDRKGGLSCAECRRSKLRCDRAIPCSACVRRGCSAICPDGTLAATKGNKVLQSQNQALQQAVKSMNARIRELETALSNTQAQISPQPHPLLTENSKLPEVDAIASLITDDGEATPSDDVEEEAAELIGAMSIGEQGQTRFHGVSTSSEYLQTLLPKPAGFTCGAFDSEHLRKLGLPEYILELAFAFPFHCITPKPEARDYLLGCLPNHAKALELTLLYFENVGYQAEIISREDFVPNILHMLLEINRATPAAQNLHPHQLAVFFLVLAIGATVSDESSGRTAGQRYYALACAALSLQPLVRESTTATLQALFIMIQYYGLVDKAVSDRRWLLSGIMIRLAHSMGLQRDPAVWELSQEEIQRRRILFWEMYTWDIWHSITLGRPPALDIRFTDCHFPDDKHSSVNEKGEKESGFHLFRYRLAAFCLSPVVNHIFSTRPQDYQQFLQLDMKLRKFQTPAALLCPTSGDGEPVDGKAWSPDSMGALQQYYCLCARESILLYIHRRYFAGAIKLNREEPTKTKYGASVLATIRSACLLLSSLRSLHGKYPKLALNQCYFWSGAFSACIVLGCLVHNSPGSSLAAQALRALEGGVDLFSKPALSQSTGINPYHFNYDILKRMVENAREMFAAYQRDGKQPVAGSDPHCSIMRVLEGARVLIKQPIFSAAVAAACASAPSTSSNSPCTSADHPTPPPSHPVPVQVQSNGSPGWTAAEHPGHSIPELSPTNPAADTLYDFSGVYYVPPNEVPLDSAVNKPNIYNLPEVTSDEVPLFDPFATVTANGVNDNGNSYADVNGAMGGVSNGPTVISIPEYPTFSSAVARQQQGAHPAEDIQMQPPVVPPAAAQANGMAGVHHQNGFSFNGPLDMNMNDRASWESFLRDLGIAT